MTSKQRLQQPRRVLESKILKHIKNASDDDKETKYNFLAREYELIRVFSFSKSFIVIDHLQQYINMILILYDLFSIYD